eukprot:1900670-Rhodomonas_salina.1
MRGRGGRGGGRGGRGGGAAGRPQRPTRACNVCHKWHNGKNGSAPEDSCWHGTDVSAERARLDGIEELEQRASQERAKDRREQSQHQQVQYMANKSDDEYSYSVSRWDPNQNIDPASYTTICLNVRQAKEYLNGAAVDSASPIDIQNDEEQAQLTCAPKIFMEGIVPGATKVPAADCSFPTVDVYGRPTVLRTKGKGILHKKATSKVISLGGLLHSGCTVHFKIGRPGDHQFGGVITHPNGTEINMIYHRGIWRLPVLTLDAAADKHHRVFLSGVTAENSGVPASNQHSVLLDLANEAEPARESTNPADMEKVSVLDQKIMQLIHERWGHPSNTKMERIGFLKALKHFSCKVCDLCKGASVYKHTKRVQEQTASNANKKRARQGDNWKQVLMETDMEDVEEGDDLLE